MTCKEASIVIIQKEEGKVSLRTRYLLWKHLLVCTWCKLFNNQSLLMNKIAKQYKSSASLTEEQKEDIIKILTTYN
jgi:hypothetical protein